VSAGRDTQITLQPGIVEWGFVYNQTYKYFRMDVSLGSDLRIRLGMISGDADLYVSVYDPNNPLALPTKNNYTWSATAFGDDALNITHGSYVGFPWLSFLLQFIGGVCCMKPQAELRVARHVHHRSVRFPELRIHDCRVELPRDRGDCIGWCASGA
jgi:hypothetical protein